MPIISVSGRINPSTKWTLEERIETARCIREQVTMQWAAGHPISNEEVCDVVTRMLCLIGDDENELEENRTKILDGGFD